MLSPINLTPILRLLLIEDNPERIRLFESWLPKEVRLITASSAGRAIGLLKTLRRNADCPFAGIMLDHDLQDQVVTDEDRFLAGSDIQMFIIRHVAPDVPILVHSMNFRRAVDMMQTLKKAGFDITRIPFSELNSLNLTEWLIGVQDIWEDR